MEQFLYGEAITQKQGQRSSESPAVSRTATVYFSLGGGEANEVVSLPVSGGGQRLQVHLWSLTKTCVWAVKKSMLSETIAPPTCLLKPYAVPHRHMFGPGPSNVPSRILAAGSQPMLGHLHAETVEVT